MNFLKKLSPHGAILVANMYYVFWGIDRVNRSMNFIDNEYTKALFVLLLVFSALNLARMYVTFRYWARGKSDGACMVRLGTMLAAAIFGIVYFILWLVDCFNPNAMLMLREFVKFWMLMFCAANTVMGVMLLQWDRGELRRRGKRRRPTGYRR